MSVKNVNTTGPLDSNGLKVQIRGNSHNIQESQRYVCFRLLGRKKYTDLTVTMTNMRCDFLE